MNAWTRLAGCLIVVLAAVGLAGADDDKAKPKLDPANVFKKLDANGDGKVTKDEFKKMADLGPAGKLKDKPELLDKMFERLDANSDGALSAEEFKKFGAGLGKGKPDAAKPDKFDADAVFKKVDADKDGKVSKEEFSKGAEHLGPGQLKDRPQILDKMFERLDADSNGTLSAEEFKKMTELREKLAERFKNKKGDR